MISRQTIAVKSWLPSVVVWFLTCASCSVLPLLLRWYSGETFNTILGIALFILTVVISVYAMTGRRADVGVESNEPTVGTLYTLDSRRGTLALSQTDPLVSMFALLVTRLRGRRSGAEGGPKIDDMIVEEGSVTSLDSVTFSPISKHPASAVREHAATTRPPAEASAVPGLFQPPTAIDDQQPTGSKYLSPQPEPGEQMTQETAEVHRSSLEHHCDDDRTMDSTSCRGDVSIVIEDVLPNVLDIADVPSNQCSSSTASPVEADPSPLPQHVARGDPGESYVGINRTEDNLQRPLLRKDESGNNEDKVEARE